jgi:hypothetical protein
MPSPQSAMPYRVLGRTGVQVSALVSAVLISAIRPLTRRIESNSSPGRRLRPSAREPAGQPFQARRNLLIGGTTLRFIAGCSTCLWSHRTQWRLAKLVTKLILLIPDRDSRHVRSYKEYRSCSPHLRNTFRNNHCPSWPCSGNLDGHTFLDLP